MEIQSIISQAMRPKVFYRTVDLAKESGLNPDQVRGALVHLAAGMIVEKEKRGRENIYITKQGDLFNGL